MWKSCRRLSVKDPVKEQSRLESSRQRTIPSKEFPSKKFPSKDFPSKNNPVKELPVLKKVPVALPSKMSMYPPGISATRTPEADERRYQFIRSAFALLFREMDEDVYSVQWTDQQLERLAHDFGVSQREILHAINYELAGAHDRSAAYRIQSTMPRPRWWHWNDGTTVDEGICMNEPYSSDEEEEEEEEHVDLAEEERGVDIGMAMDWNPRWDLADSALSETEDSDEAPDSDEAAKSVWKGKGVDRGEVDGAWKGKGVDRGEVDGAWKGKGVDRGEAVDRAWKGKGVDRGEVDGAWKGKGVDRGEAVDSVDMSWEMQDEFTKLSMQDGPVANMDPQTSLGHGTMSFRPRTNVNHGFGLSARPGFISPRDGKLCRHVSLQGDSISYP